MIPSLVAFVGFVTSIYIAFTLVDDVVDAAVVVTAFGFVDDIVDALAVAFLDFNLYPIVMSSSSPSFIILALTALNLVSFHFSPRVCFT